jgi:hypothetical protein
MRLSLCDLHITFQERATWTSSIIENGFSSRLGVLEETITDVNLIEISRRHSGYVLTKKFTRREEGSNSGADWLWCIGEPGAWFPLLVQAKVINPSTSTCHFLNYRSGKQRRLLLEFARRHRLFPIYCLYSQITDDLHPLSKSLPSLSNVDSSEWACALVIPKFVRQLVDQKRKKQVDLLQYGIPWTFPFYYATQNEDQKLAHSLAEAMQKVSAEFKLTAANLSVKSSSSKHPSEGVTRIRWENPDPIMLINPNLPSVVMRLIKGKISPLKSPIAGVSIVSCVPIEVALNAQKTLSAADGEVFLTNRVDESYGEQVSSEPRTIGRKFD